jgi:hypothetical protein
MNTRSNAELKFNSKEDKESFVIGFLSLCHDKSCCLELVNKSNTTLEISFFGSLDKKLLQKIEELYGSMLIFNIDNANKHL